MTDSRVTPQAVQAAAAKLSATHWDGAGCGTNGAMGCSYCFGPSPASAHEVAQTVLAAAVPLLCQPLQDENERLRAIVDALVSALERTEANFVLSVHGKPVRDMCENLAENRAAMTAAVPVGTE